MSKFENSEWKNKKSAEDFVDNSENYLMERKRLLNILKSFYHHFLMEKSLSKNHAVKILDLGCGDGKLTEELLSIDPEIEVTLIDGSLDMLNHAQKRFKHYDNINYIQKTFQDLILEKEIHSSFDFIISSLAIHHLNLDQKKNLYEFVYNYLSENGFFFNIDVVKSSDMLEEWYLQLWKEWILEKEKKSGASTNFSHIPTKYKNNPDNRPDPLEKQLEILKDIGFKNVDCYYKYGIFTAFGGRK